jgi:hypothetical protein
VGGSDTDNYNIIGPNVLTGTTDSYVGGAINALKEYVIDTQYAGGSEILFTDWISEFDDQNQQYGGGDSESESNSESDSDSESDILIDNAEIDDNGIVSNQIEIENNGIVSNQIEIENNGIAENIVDTIYNKPESKSALVDFIQK